MVEKLKAQLKLLNELDKKRILWFRFSGLVFLAIVGLIIDWTFISNTKWAALVFSLGLILSAVWWYWTMSVVRQMVDQRKAESSALIEIIEDIKEIKKNVRELDKGK